MWFGGRVLAVAAQDAMYRLRKEIFEHTQTLSLRFFDRQPIGDLMSRITNDLDSVGQLFDKGLSADQLGVHARDHDDPDVHRQLAARPRRHADRARSSSC